MRGKPKPKSKVAPKKEATASTFTSMTTAKWGAHEDSLYMNEGFHLGLATFKGTMSHFMNRGSLDERGSLLCSCHRHFGKRESLEGLLP